MSSVVPKAEWADCAADDIRYFPPVQNRCDRTATAALLSPQHAKSCGLAGPTAKPQVFADHLLHYDDQTLRGSAIRGPLSLGCVSIASILRRSAIRSLALFGGDRNAGLML